MRLERLAGWCYHRRWSVLGIWVAALVAVGVLAAAAGGQFASSFQLLGAESQRAADVLEERFPARAGDTGTIVFRADRGVSDPGVRARMDRLFWQASRIDHVAAVASPYAPGAGAVSRDGKIAFATIQFDVRGRDLPAWVVQQLQDRTRAASGRGLQIELGGQVVRFAQRGGAGGREGLGLLAAVVILLLTFGSVIAMGLPILTAVFALGVGLAALGLMARVLEVPDATPQLALMIGLGVGIDYALLIVTRFRQNLHAGLDLAAATILALATAGRAVLLAGSTVVISLLGMFLMGIPFVAGLALGAVVVVLVTMAASLTLLPAVLGFAGRGIDRLRVRWLHRNQAAHRTRFFFRWSRLVQRHPWRAAGAALVLLIPLALPVFSMRLGVADAGNDPTSRTTRRAYDLLSEGFGPGFNGPLVLAAEMPGPGGKATLERLGERLRHTHGVALVTPPSLSPSGGAAVLTVFPTTAPQDARTEDLIRRLRAEVIPGVVKGTGVSVSVGGITALFIDMSQTIGHRLLLLLGAVIALSFLLLMAVFRSLLVPLKAAVMNLLSIGAAYGVLVAVFQWGWGKTLVGIDRTGPIESYVPAMLFAILFGLSMDYEVFLLSRVREEYLRSRDNASAVADGLAATARVITAAAAVMVTVFLSFVLGDNRLIKLAGLGLASAIFLDATLIRMVLVPATMALLGEANWWFPRWLDRIVPRIGMDGRAPGRGRPGSPDRTVEPAGSAEASAGSPAPVPAPTREAEAAGHLRKRGAMELKARAAGRTARPNRTYPPGRVCAVKGCGTRLSTYNRRDRCWPHQPVLPSVPRGKTRAFEVA